MSKTSKPRVFSVGYQRMTPDEVKALVLRLDAVLLDVRSRPAGRVKRGFARADLETLLGDRYEWHGRDLGGRGAGPTVEALLRLSRDPHRIVLMCQEHAPGDCHRHHRIAVPLAAAGVDVFHVYEGQLVRAGELQRAIDEDTEYRTEPLANGDRP